MGVVPDQLQIAGELPEHTDPGVSVGIGFLRQWIAPDIEQFFRYPDGSLPADDRQAVEPA